MSALRDVWARGVEQMRAQWQSSVLVRIGLVAVFVLVAVEASLRLMDQSDAWDQQRIQLEQQLQQDDAGTVDSWKARAAEAALARSAWEQREWVSDDLGLLEAQIQDRVRDLAGKARLSVRDLGLVRNPTEATDRAIRVRVQLEFNRPGMLALLAELENMTPPLLVDRLHLRLNSQPQVLELELKAVRKRSADSGGR